MELGLKTPAMYLGHFSSSLVTIFQHFTYVFFLSNVYTSLSSFKKKKKTTDFRGRIVCLKPCSGINF